MMTREELMEKVDTMRRNRELLKKYGLAFTLKCTNALPAVEYRTVNGKQVKEPKPYRRDDLTRFAMEAFENGKKSFYTEPVDPKDPYGPIRRCEPKYAYVSTKNLSTEEYELLVSALETLENEK